MGWRNSIRGVDVGPREGGFEKKVHHFSPAMLTDSASGMFQKTTEAMELLAGELNLKIWHDRNPTHMVFSDLEAMEKETTNNTKIEFKTTKKSSKHC